MSPQNLFESNRLHRDSRKKVGGDGSGRTRSASAASPCATATLGADCGRGGTRGAWATGGEVILAPPCAFHQRFSVCTIYIHTYKVYRGGARMNRPPTAGRAGMGDVSRLDCAAVRGRTPASAATRASAADPGRWSERAVRSGQNMRVGPCIPEGTQLRIVQKADVDPTSGPTASVPCPPGSSARAARARAPRRAAARRPGTAPPPAVDITTRTAHSGALIW